MWNRLAWFFKIFISLVTPVPCWFYIFTFLSLKPVYLFSVLQYFSVCLFSGLMALLLFRSKPRTAQPPALQACYEKPPVLHMMVAGTLSQATNWCLTICYQTTAAEIWEDFNRSQSSGLHFISFSTLLSDCLLSHYKLFLNNYNYCCTCISCSLMAWMLTAHTGRVKLLIRVAKDT